MSMTPEGLVTMMRDVGGGISSPFALGSISSIYAAGLPAVLFDGETADSTRLFPHLSSYTPVASDRVLLARVGHGFVVLGKITAV